MVTYPGNTIYLIRIRINKIRFNYDGKIKASKTRGAVIAIQHIPKPLSDF